MKNPDKRHKYYKKFFLKLFNNSNIVYDCRNDLDNCTFDPTCDKIDKISYRKKVNKIFDKTFSSFVNPEIIKHEYVSEFNEKC